MYDTYDPQRTRKSHPCKTPGERVHGRPGGIHDGRPNSLSLLHDQDAKRSVEVTRHQLRGFMVAARGVHGGAGAAVLTAPMPRELTAARSAVRSSTPSLQRTSGAPTAAARRPGRTTLPGIAVSSPCLPWWGSYSVISLRQESPAISDACCPCPLGGCAMKLSQPDRIPRKDREPVGLALSPVSATIMKVAARHEANSKIDVQYYWTLWRCRWPTQWACPRALLEVAALGERA
jgi:hypothetical protein